MEQRMTHTPTHDPASGGIVDCQREQEGADAPCRTDLGPLTKKILEQQQEIERLRAQRDEARQMYCCAWVDLFPRNPKWSELGLLEAAAIAADEFDWDCYKFLRCPPKPPRKSSGTTALKRHSSKSRKGKRLKP
jgi:hypothetical protein